MADANSSSTFNRALAGIILIQMHQLLSRTVRNKMKLIHLRQYYLQFQLRPRLSPSAMYPFRLPFLQNRGWSGGAKVLCILHHWGVQLILAYSWARPAILVVGKGRGGMFLFLLFLHFHSCSSFFPVPLFHLLYCLLSLFSLSLGDDTK